MPPPPALPPPPLIVAYTFEDVRYGPYSLAAEAGTTFTFVGRDVDGLPIVGESFNGCELACALHRFSPPLLTTASHHPSHHPSHHTSHPSLCSQLLTCRALPLDPDPRIEAFSAELHWIGAQPAPVERLPITFVGNRIQQSDGTYQVIPDPPRAQDGTFRVTVSLARTGLHSVRIRGPP
jgi:hypothetical protein